MKKTLILTVALLLAISVFAGCGKAELPGDLPEEEVYAAAQQVINDFNGENYDGIVDAAREDVKAQLPAETLKTAYDAYIPAMGAFSEFGKSEIKTSTDKTTKETFIAAIISAKYENGTLTYTVNFNEKLEIVGFYFK